MLGAKSTICACLALTVDFTVLVMVAAVCVYTGLNVYIQ